MYFLLSITEFPFSRGQFRGGWCWLLVCCRVSLPNCCQHLSPPVGQTTPPAYRQQLTVCLWTETMHHYLSCPALQ